MSDWKRSGWVWNGLSNGQVGNDGRAIEWVCGKLVAERLND